MIPTKIQLHKKSKTLELHFGAKAYILSAEYLRVFSPSAEVKGHGPGQEVLQHGKCNVGISNLESQGNYAIKFVFDDGHDSGIYSWEYLFKLANEEDDLWQDYLSRLNEAGKSRDPNESPVKIF